METKRGRGPFWPAAAAVVVAVSVFVFPALIRGEGLLPVGALWRFPPWNAILPPAADNLLLSDQLLYFWPWLLYLRDGLLSGHFPLWNPLIYAGVPFLACVQAAPLFPTKLLLAVMPPAAWSLAAAFLKLFAGGLFTALYARRLGADRSGQALAGVSFALCGFMTAWLGHPHTNAACLLPALFWSLSRAFELSGRRPWIPVSLIVALVLLGGHPPTALHVLAAGAAYAVFLAAGAAGGRRRLGSAGLAGLAGALLAAPALLPYLEYLGQSSTAASAEAVARWSGRMSPWVVLHWLMPLASGPPGAGSPALDAAFSLPPSSNFLERAGWVGLPSLAFAALALARRGRGGEARFLAALSLFGAAAALAVWPLPWVWRILPAFSAVNPTRLLLLACFGTSVLAGLGCAEKDGSPPARLVAGLSVFFCGTATLYLVMIGRVAGGMGAAERGFAASQAMAFILESGAAVTLLALPAWRRWAWLAALPFLSRAAFAVNPPAPATLLYPATPGIRALAAEQGEGRVLGLGWALTPDLGMPFGLRDARGIDLTTPRRYEELMTGRAGDFGFYSNASALPPRPVLDTLSALAATPRTAGLVPPGWAKVADGDLLVFRAPRPGRRAFFVPEARTGPSERVLAAVRDPGFDPERMLWLDDGLSVEQTSGATGTARVSLDENDRVDVEVDADGPGWLLLVDLWYPGWRVRVNGAPSALRRGDYAFRAVAVPAGRSTVVFRYAPLSLGIGLVLAVLSAIGLGWAWRPG